MAKQISQTKNQLAATKEALDKVIATRAGSLENRINRARIEVDARLSELALKLSETRTDHGRAILDQKLRMEAFLGNKQTTGPRGEATRAEPELSHLLDPFYLSFEDRYRGTRDDIKSRQGVYLEQVAACVAATGQGAVIDIGCGRGEWLELLADSGIAARGFDLNRIAVEECRARGLDVAFADAIEALAQLPEESCSVITAFHIIEHLPFEVLVRLIDHSLRALRPGGILISETPNPANLVVAAEKFYFDPTHRNPLPAELTSYLLESRGFSEVRIMPLHPVSSAPRQTYEDPMLAYLQDKLYGPQDYAALARKSP
jgi:O-antigen chain-terminating methyltransferase